MVKKLQKTFAVALLILMLISTICFASDSETVLYSATDENSQVAETAEPSEAVVSEDADKASEEESETAEPAETTGEAEQKEEMLSDDLYLFNETVESTQVVDGNAYVLGNNVTFSSVVGGDVFILGNTVNITEDALIYGNLYVLSNELTIDGFVYGGDLYAACSKLTLNETGAVNRDIRASAGEITLNGGVGRNVYVTSSAISIGEKAQIYGNLNYSSKDAIQVPTGVVRGTINFEEVQAQSSDEAENRNPVISYVFDFVQSIVYTLAILGVLIWIAPKFLNNLENVELGKILPSIGFGLLALVVPVIAVVLLLISYVGVSIAFALLSSWALLVFGLAKSVAIIAVAGVLAKKISALSKAHNILAVLLTSVVVWALSFVPFVGGIISFLLFVYGLGLLVLNIFRKKQVEE